MTEEKMEETPVDIRIGMIGNVDSGKSTLIGTLAYGDLDDGRGSSREKVLKLRHEHDTGRTSCISHHIMGFDEERNVVHQTAIASAAPQAKNKSWGKVMKESTKTVTFVDLAGHEKYLKTMISGLSGTNPHYACIAIGANMGVSKMTKEHLAVALGLEIPFFVVINKVDLAPEKILKRTLKQLYKILRHPQMGKNPFLVKKKKDITTYFGGDTGEVSTRVCPIFLVSSVQGTNIDLLTQFISRLDTPMIEEVEEKMEDEMKEEFLDMEIDDVFRVTGVGVVVSGYLPTGSIEIGQALKIGPFIDGYRNVVVRGLHIKRVTVKKVVGPIVCTVAIRSADRKTPVKKSQIRRGMTLTDRESTPCTGFLADLVILHHPTTIKDNFQAVAHCGAVQQTVKLQLEDDEVLRSGDRKSDCQFSFLYRPERIKIGTSIVFREGSTKAFGRVTQLTY